MGHVAQRILPEEAKVKIREDLRAYCGRFASLDIAANTLKNVGATTLRNMLNPDFPNISDAMWRSVRAQIGGGSKSEWVHVNTSVTEDLRFIMGETQQEQGFTWAVSPAGSGKTATATMFAKEAKNVFHLQCDADMSKSEFSVELARAVGLRVRTSLKGDTVVTVDGAADIADIIYTQGAGIAAHALAHKIHEAGGEVELTDAEARIVEEIINRCCAPHHIDAILSQLKSE